MGYLLSLLFVLLLADILHSFSFFFFSALSLLVEQRKGIRPVKNWMLGCWRGYLPRARCRLAYGLADATATHCLCFSKIQIGPGSPRKRAIKWVCVHVCARARARMRACVRVCVCVLFFSFLVIMEMLQWLFRVFAAYVIWQRYSVRTCAGRLWIGNGQPWV